MVFEARGVDVDLAGARVLSGVDLQLSEGEFALLLGPNGSGKTTLVRALLGLTPASGEIKLFGTALDRFDGWERIGFVPQRFTAASGVPATVAEVVLSGRIAKARRLRAYSQADVAAAQRALEAAGLGSIAGARVSALSGGQQQRVLIARALAGEPDVLVLDEPVSSVDIASQESFAHTLERFHRRGGTILLVAHGLGALAPLVTRAIALDGGAVVYDGPPVADIHDEHAHHEEQRPHGIPGGRR